MSRASSASVSASRTRTRGSRARSELGAGDRESPAVSEDRTASGLAQRAYETRTASPYLVVEEVAERLRCAVSTVHELTRTRSIPHRRLPGSRRCLFLETELEAWEAGAELDARELPRGGRVVEVKS